MGSRVSAVGLPRGPEQVLGLVLGEPALSGRAVIVVAMFGSGPAHLCVTESPQLDRGVEAVGPWAARCAAKFGAHAAVVLDLADLDQPFPENTRLLDTISTSLAGDLLVLDVLAVRGNCWRSLACRVQTCCPLTGRSLPEALAVGRLEVSWFPYLPLERPHAGADLNSLTVIG